MILHSQLASVISQITCQDKGVLEHAPLWRRRYDFRYIEIICPSRIKGGTQSWALALLTSHAWREEGEERKEVQTSAVIFPLLAEPT